MPLCRAEAIADQARTIRIPVHMIETINKLIRTSRYLVQEIGREPTPEEIANGEKAARALLAYDKKPEGVDDAGWNQTKTALQSQQTMISTKISDYQNLNTKMLSLQSAARALQGAAEPVRRGFASAPVAIPSPFVRVPGASQLTTNQATCAVFGFAGTTKAASCKAHPKRTLSRVLGWDA